MSSHGGTFQIIQGVRRARAFQLAGYKTIRAVLHRPDGTYSPEFDVAIDDLRSPYKSDIDMSTNSQADRFWRIWNLVRSGQVAVLPPIIVEQGSQGKTVQEIGWTY